MIYTHFFTPVEFVETRIVTLWNVHHKGTIRNYDEDKLPKRLSSKAIVNKIRDMQATLRVLPNDQGMEAGKMIRDGAWESICYLKADDGWKEIVNTWREKHGMTKDELEAALYAA